MASTKNPTMKLHVLTLLSVLAAVLFHRSAAQSGCSSALTGMAPCLNYVTGNSPKPSSSCCSQLSNVVQSSPRCLCSVINGGGSSVGVNINQTLALQLPAACNVQTPPVSKCNAVNNGPTTAPADSPGGFPADNDTPGQGALTPSAYNFPSGTGSKKFPWVNGVSSNTNINAVLSVASIVLVLTRI